LDNSNFQFSVPLHGEHNVLNVVASIIMSIEEGIKINEISEALLTCKTVERRFEVISNNIFNKGITLIDDYGHHPKEISVTLETVDKIWKNNKKIVIFQPHRYTRTKALFEEFVEILSKIDDLILLDVYPASEKILKGYESNDLYKAANKRNNIIKAEGVEDALEKLKKLVSDHSLILTQGAGNTSTLAKLISEYQ
jgi:UDP-N-acetylmuramate--alanine ligase